MVLAAVVQMSSQSDLAKNLLRVEALVARAAKGGASLVVLPENFALMGDDALRREVAEDLEAAPGPILACLRRAAREAQVAIVGGGLPERSEEPGSSSSRLFVRKSAPAAVIDATFAIARHCSNVS